MDNTYDLEKSIWTHHDFDVMGWHDAQIHGVAIYSDVFELAFDIDYIFHNGLTLCRLSLGIVIGFPHAL